MNKLKFSYFILGIIFFVYAFIRVFSVGLTYDEIWTITTFVPQNTLDIITYNTVESNNHLLNTLLIKLFFIFSNQDYVARLPNLFIFLIYIYYSYKITYYNFPFLVGLCCFFVLLANPFMLEFFSLARGYGLALALLLASIHFLIYYIQGKGYKFAIISLLFGSLSVLSNFTSLNYFLAILTLINFIPYIDKKRNYLPSKLHFISVIISFTLFIIIYLPLKKLKINGILVYGGDSNLYHDTLLSLTKYCMCEVNNMELIYIVLNSFLIVLLVTLSISYYRNNKFLSIKNCLFLVLLLIFIELEIQNKIFNIPFLTDRTAFFVYPLLILLLFFSVNDVLSKLYSSIIILTIAIGFTLNLFFSVNLYKTRMWFFDAHSEKILELLQQKSKFNTVKIDFSWPLQASLFYYNIRNKYENFIIVNNMSDRIGYNRDADYYVFLNKPLEEVGYNPHNQIISHEKFKKIFEFSEEGIIIFEIKK